MRGARDAVGARDEVRLELRYRSRAQARRLTRWLRRNRGTAVARTKTSFRDLAGNVSVERLRVKLR